MKLTFFISIAWLFMVSNSFACSSTFDCAFGSVCIKSDINFDRGVCVGDFHSGNTYDADPILNEDSQGDTIGITCTFDSECGSGRECLEGACQ